MLRLRRTVKAGKKAPQKISSHGGKRLRHELKFIINEGTYRVLRARLSPLTVPDAYGGGVGYRVTSLYFDDLYASGYLDKLNGVLNRRKFRVRCYDLDPSHITLEAKHKDGEYVYKISDAMTKEQYKALLSGDCSFMSAYDGEESAFGEFYRSDRLVSLKPKVIVDYFRDALIYPFGNVRITFDKKLSTCYNTIDMFDKDAFFSPVFDREIILEIKYDDYLPDSIEQALKGLNAPRLSVSKYVICYDKISEVRLYV